MEKNSERQHYREYIFLGNNWVKLKELLESVEELLDRGVDEETIVIEYDIDDGLEMYGYRAETDEEYNLRLEKARQMVLKRSERAKKAAETKLANEKALYEKLKKKFGE